MSYIKIVCTDDADPRYNRLQLRTTPPTYIELQPGENILTVDEYPDLKHGFSQIDCANLDDKDACENIIEYNCGNIVMMDLSNFDFSEMTSMKGMFKRMENLTHLFMERIFMGGLERIKNITSMASAFEWTGAGMGAGEPMDRLDLSIIDFSQVKDASFMLYGCPFPLVDLSTCDMSQINSAESIFDNNSIQYLILDNAKLSKEIIEEIQFTDWCSLRSISMRGCDFQTIRSVLKAILDERPDTWPRVEVIIDITMENKILHLGGLVGKSWFVKHRNEWYLTINNESLSFIMNEFPIIFESLKEENLMEDFYLWKSWDSVSLKKEYYPYCSVYSTGFQFPTTLIKSIFDWSFGAKFVKADSFVVGNYKAAFSNDKDLKYYVPVLHRGFRSIEDALTVIGEVVQEDLSDYKILEIQYIDPAAMPETLHYSKVWSPLKNGKFTLPEVWKGKFRSLFSKMEEECQEYIQECLTKLIHTTFNHNEICTDVKGNKHVFNPAKIIMISPYSDNDRAFAKVHVEGNLTLTVDLVKFTKELTGYEPLGYCNPTPITSERVSKTINVANTELKDVFKSIEEKVTPIIEKMRQEWQEEQEKRQSYPQDDDDDIADLYANGESITEE